MGARHLIGGVLAFSGLFVACANAGDETTPNSTIDWTTGSGGAGGATSQGSGAGNSSTRASGGSGGMGPGMGGGGGSGTTSSGAGGGAGSTLLVLLAGGSGQFLAGGFDGSTWTVNALAGTTTSAPSLAFGASGTALGVARASSGALQFTAFDGAGWLAFADVGASVNTSAAPSLGAGATLFHTAFLGIDNKHYYAARGAAWSPDNEPVQPNAGTHAFGPSEGRIAVLGDDSYVAYAGDDNGLYIQPRVSGAWQTAFNVTGAALTLPPSIVALDAGPDLLAVWANDGDGKLYWSSGTSAGAFLTGALIDDAVFTAEAFNMAALAGGRAVVAYRGSDGKPYTILYDPNGNPNWSVPIGVEATNPDVPSAPAVAAGVGGQTAEVAYVKGGVAYHARMLAGSWGAPANVGGSSLSYVSIARP